MINISTIWVLQDMTMSEADWLPYEVPLLLQRNVTVSDGCLTPALGQDVTESMHRPAFVPGKQRMTNSLDQTGCINSSTAPPMQRCWPLVFSFDDVVMYGQNIANFNAELAGYVLWLDKTPVRCVDVMSDACVKQYDVIGCFYKLYPYTQDPPPSNDDVGAADGGLGGIAGSGTGTGGAGGDGGRRQGQRPVIAGTLGGVFGGLALLGGLLGAALVGLRRRRQARQQRREASSKLDDAAFSRASDSGNGNRVTPLTPPKPGVNLRLDLGGGELELLPGVIGKGTFGRVVPGRYGGQPVAVKLLDHGLLPATTQPRSKMGQQRNLRKEQPPAEAALLVAALAVMAKWEPSLPSTLRGHLVQGTTTAPQCANETLSLSAIRPLAEQRAAPLLPMVPPTSMPVAAAGGSGNNRGIGGGNAPTAAAAAGHGSYRQAVVLENTESSMADHIQSSPQAPSDRSGGCDPRDGVAKPRPNGGGGDCGGGHGVAAGGAGGDGGGCGVAAGGCRCHEVSSRGGHNGTTAAAAAAAAAAEPTAMKAVPADPRHLAFLQEAEVMARMQHPNIVRLLAANTTPPKMCLVMELMETSLERLMYGNGGDGPGELMPLDKVLHIGLQVAAGLEYLHPTIVHRDLKPANVLISNAASPTPIVKLADFGLSRLQTSVIVTENVGVGTVGYMAPETFSETNCVVTDRMDVFALGMILWEMLAGVRPWRGLNLIQVAVAVALMHQRPPLEALAPERCPRKLRNLIEGCWDKVPERRPAAAEVVKELLLIRLLLQKGDAKKEGGATTQE
ncbi:hypothetical protein VOLCADRAFT_96096 [Volvox carteri f. nagariensis]|uniref:Protein kinase domain-containing protein n=1 Tax=Volvox carteri f. nagariensis TaxID=3068 RepID=D8U972_VOLCA|nr:uncharacterized protein VOLCADRAFT_96096 [Volvox carteri f. nagariensis]EFJ43758.1 hypothetical protein VOLCADRAFT_96096 [Volvox carteri f. nagariensis]|eukprot:XP_002955239.1 hypothetical protein VOLCADRAFT_96096 [Volvox carteri f. nagariensis]